MQPFGPFDGSPPSMDKQKVSTKIFETGIKVIDNPPLEQGGKSGFFGSAGVGKTVLIMEMIRDMVGIHEGVSLFCGIGDDAEKEKSGICTCGRVHGPCRSPHFGHLSSSIVLSRKKAGEGLYPAVDPLQSNSSMLTPDIVGRTLALPVKFEKPAEYEDLKDIISMLGIEELSREDRRTVTGPGAWNGF
ncbi:MAG: hypothetical protein U5K27_04910 [Desulfotignum sp.]|nr:hypothetical protein [Desulfotignum sp.]